MKRIIRQAGLLAGAALVLTTGSSALAGEPARKDGPVKVESKVIVMKDGEQVVVSSNDVGRPMPMRKHWDPAARADHLRTILQLRPEQEPALKAFLEATRPPERKIVVRTDKDGQPPAPPEARKPLTTPERLDRQAKMMAEHQAGFQKRAAATRVFYGQLTPSQQKVFDTLGHGGGRQVRIMRRGGPDGHMRGPGGPGGERRIIMRRGAPEGGPPAPGGMAWMDDDGVDFAMLDDEDADVQVFLDGDQIPGDDD